MLRERWSPEQISGTLRRCGQLSISHETIYRHVWADRRRGGGLHVHLRCASKARRKRYGRYDRRGRMVGKRHISERPTGVQGRRRQGHWEIDTVLGNTSGCVVTLVERKTAETHRATIDLIKRHPLAFKTITSDNGSEFHEYEKIERATGVKFYLAKPHHSWERETNENTNGLLRQYLPQTD